MTTKSKKQAAASAPSPGSGTSSPFALISDQKFLALYAALLKCRMIEEASSEPFKNNGLAAKSPGLGREAPAVGVAIDLLPRDAVAPCHGDLLVPYIKGAPLSRLLTPRAARSRSYAARLRAVLRAAGSSKAKKNNKIAVAFYPDEPTALAPWREVMRRARAQRLPILFVSHSHASVDDIPLKIKDYGFPCIAVDGSDVVAIYRVASEAIAHARRGNGPTLIECLNAPPSGPKRNRGREATDPIRKMEKYLNHKGLSIARLKAKVAAGFKLELRAARRASTPRPNPVE